MKFQIEQIKDVEDGLNLYRVPGLLILAKELGVKCPSRKEDLVKALTSMMTGESLRGVLNRLSDLEKNAVAEVVHSDGEQLDRSRFEAKYGDVPNSSLDDSGGYRRLKEASPQSLLPLFLYRGKIPAAMKTELSHFVPKPKAVEIKTQDQIPGKVQLAVPRRARHDKEGKYKPQFADLTLHETTRAALHDLFTVLRLVEAGKITVSEQTRRVSLSGAKAILSVLYGGDFYPAESVQSASDTIRPFAWPLLLQAAKLVMRTGAQLKLSALGKKALGEPPHEVIKKIFDDWINSDVIDEFNRIDAIKGQTGKGKRYLSDPSSRRDQIIAALWECPVGRWIDLKEFGRFLRAQGHDFEITENPWTFYLGDPHYGSLGYDGYHNWEILQGRYLMAFLLEYLATLGMIDVATIPPEGAQSDYSELGGSDDLNYLSRYDGLCYLRLNALGAYCLDISDNFEAPPFEIRQALKVMPNLEIALTGEAELLPSDHLLLSRFAEKVSDRLWRLQPQTILAAATEEGLPLKEMIEFLSARNGEDLPDTVKRTFQDIQERLAKLSYRGASHLLEVNDPMLAQILANESALRPLCFLAGERYLVVPADNAAAFKRGLRELGYACKFGLEPKK